MRMTSKAKRVVGVILPLVLLLVAGLAPSPAEALEGRVVGVHDGDTITVLTAARERVRVRLAGIDAPEKRQPYGTRAKAVLAALVFGRNVRLEVTAKDRYGRTVAHVYRAKDGLWVNREMVRRGAAWVYRRYARRKALYDAEAEAKVAPRGIWRLPAHQQVPPWEWRRRHRRSEASPRGTTVAGWMRELRLIAASAARSLAAGLEALSAALGDVRGPVRDDEVEAGGRHI